MGIIDSQVVSSSVSAAAGVITTIYAINYRNQQLKKRRTSDPIEWVDRLDKALKQRDTENEQLRSKLQEARNTIETLQEDLWKANRVIMDLKEKVEDQINANHQLQDQVKKYRQSNS